MAEKDSSLSIVYEELQNRPTLIVSGAIGGPTPDATLLVAHLYLDSPTLPALEEHKVDPAGFVDLSKGSRIKRSDITRSVIGTMVLTPLVAVQLGQWLLDRGTELQSAGKKRQ